MRVACAAKARCRAVKRARMKDGVIWGLRIARLTMMTHVCLCFRARSVDPFTKKDWYDIKAPSMFSVRNIGKTLVSRTAGTKVRDFSSAIARVL